MDMTTMFPYYAQWLTELFHGTSVAQTLWNDKLTNSQEPLKCLNGHLSDVERVNTLFIPQLVVAVIIVVV